VFLFIFDVFSRYILCCIFNVAPVSYVCMYGQQEGHPICKNLLIIHKDSGFWKIPFLGPSAQSSYREQG